MNNNRRRNYRPRPQKNSFRRRNGSINTSANTGSFNNGNVNFNRNGSMNSTTLKKLCKNFNNLQKMLKVMEIQF